MRPAMHARMRAILKSLTGRSGGGAVDAPVVTGNPSLLASWDFGDVTKITMATGIPGAGTIASISPSDGTSYSLTSNVAGGGQPLSIVRSGQITSQFTTTQYMQVGSGLGASGVATTMVVVMEPTDQNISTAAKYKILDIADSTQNFAKSRLQLDYGGSTGTFWDYRSDSSGSRVNSTINVTGFAGARCLVARSSASATGTADFFIDGQTSATVSGSTGAAPSGLTTTTLGASMESGAISTPSGMYLTRVLVYAGALSDAQIAQIFQWSFTNYKVIGTPIPAVVLNRPVIAPLTTGSAVTWTAGQIIGYPAPTVTYSLYKNGTLISSNATSGSYTTTTTNDLIYVIQNAVNVNGTSSSTSLTMLVDGPAYYPVLAGVGVAGSPLGVYIPDYSYLTGNTITAYQWYKNQVGDNNITGQIAIPGATSSTITPASTDVGCFYSCTVTLPSGVQYSTVEFGNTITANTAGMCPTLPQNPDTCPATAARPSSSTGVGFYTASNGGLYDANGNRFRMRGMNATHWDSLISSGAWNVPANAVRIFMDQRQSWSTNQPLLDNPIAHHQVPIIVGSAAWVQFTGSISSGVLTVTAVSVGQLIVGTLIVNALGGSTVGIVSAILTGSGKAGTYSLSSAVDTPLQSLYGAAGTSGGQDPSTITACVTMFIDNYSHFGPYERQSIINIANEWGPTASASNTVWRDTYMTEVPRMRAAGYKGTLQIDAGNSGQDSYCLLNHAAAVLAADPEHNLQFSLHVYGSYKVGQLATITQQMYALAQSQGIHFVIGEFGPGHNTGFSPTNIDPLEVVSDCEANHIGWLAWAWDDHTSGPPAGDSWFCMSQDWYNSYKTTTDPSTLTNFGRKIVLNPEKGFATKAVAATVV